MSFLRPKFITFDCYGTLTNFHMGTMTRELFADRIPAERMDAFVKMFSAYRLDEVMGDWQPYDVILKNALERTCKRWNVAFKEAEARLYYDAVPTWGPHPDVTAGLAKIADKIPLVIFSNASDSQIMSNVDKLGVPFHKVFTADQAKVYKPRLAAFEFM
ncbi:haloacid dehalogenase type II, partial [Pseudomonas sp.]|uniref:haloacid dehalogenase type II n=1 Tax=Pseudomonas sp. TaxID=306 RepID=UPI003CC53489